MAVIITDMDMPKSCADCRFRSCCDYGINGWLMNKRDDKCPLKSADEMTKEIKALGTWSRSLGSVTIPYHRVEDIIHKYTYKEQEDGNDD